MSQGRQGRRMAWKAVVVAGLLGCSAAVAAVADGAANPATPKPADTAPAAAKTLSQVLDDEAAWPADVTKALDGLPTKSAGKEPGDSSKAFATAAEAVHTAVVAALATWKDNVLLAVATKPEVYDAVRSELATQNDAVANALDRASSAQAAAIGKAYSPLSKDEKNPDAAHEKEMADRLTAAKGAVTQALADALAARKQALGAAEKQQSVTEQQQAFQRGLEEGRTAAVHELLNERRNGEATPTLRCELIIKSNPDPLYPTCGRLTATLDCGQQALLLSAHEVATVSIFGARLHDARRIELTGRMAESMRSSGDPASEALSSQTVVLSAGGSPDITQGVPLEVDVHVDRWWGPSYGDGAIFQYFDSAKLASLTQLRKTYPEKVSLVSRGRGLKLKVAVALDLDGQTLHAESDIDVIYERWKVDTSSLFSVTPLSGKELVFKTETAVVDGVEKSTTKVVGVRNTDNYHPETSLFVSLVPQNYRVIGIGFGLHAGSGGDTSYLFGPTVRLLGIGDHAVASFVGGIMGSRVKDFPEIHCKDGVCTETGDKARDGRLTYRHDWFAGISLGFRFDFTSGGN